MQNNEETKEMLFSKEMKLADLIAANYTLILVLPRFGISLGFGEKSVETVCRTNNIPCEFFLMVCNVYTFDHYIPDMKIPEKINMRLLVSYLRESHKYYINERIPHIGMHLRDIAENAGGKSGAILEQFYADYLNEVSEHFNYEEKTVFPHIEALEKGISDNIYKINQFIEHHSDIEEKLDDLTQIIYKYLPGNVLPNESIELVFDILHLSSDIKKHTLIEEKILVPYVEYLETRADEQKN